jgi:putative NADPH-quinone reductase
MLVIDHSQQHWPPDLTKICIIQGHPDSTTAHLCHGLAEAYREGAKAGCHNISEINIGAMDIACLRDPAQMERKPSPAIVAAQHSISQADHLMIIYPLWLGTMPALVKAFFEHVACGEFLIGKAESGWPVGKLKGKSARLVVTMGMPSAAYKILMGADGVRGFESGILGIAGVGPIRETLLGGVGSDPKRIGKWMEKRGSSGSGVDTLIDVKTCRTSLLKDFPGFGYLGIIP